MNTFCHLKDTRYLKYRQNQLRKVKLSPFSEKKPLNRIQYFTSKLTCLLKHTRSITTKGHLYHSLDQTRRIPENKNGQERIPDF